MAFCKSTTASLPSPSLPKHIHIPFLSSSLPFPLKQNHTFSLSCQSDSSSHSSHVSPSFSHQSPVFSRSLVSLSSSDFVEGLLEVAINDHQKAQHAIQERFRSNRIIISTLFDGSGYLVAVLTMHESQDLEALYVMSKYREFGMHFCDSVDTLKLNVSYLNKVPFGIVESMKLRTREVLQAQVQDEEMMGSYQWLMLRGYDDHHKQQHEDDKENFSEKCSSCVLLIKRRVMQLFQRDDRNDLVGIMGIPAILEDAYLYGAFCSMSYDELSEDASGR